MSERRPGPGAGDEAPEGTAPGTSTPVKVEDKAVEHEPGTHKQLVESSLSTLEEQGYVTPMARVTFVLRPQKMKLRQELGILDERRDLKRTPGKLYVAKIGTCLSRIGDTTFTAESSIEDRIAALAPLPASDLSYIAYWIAVDRDGDNWRYPWAFNCGRCDAPTVGLVHIDLAVIPVVVWPDLPAGTWPRSSYRLLTPCDLPGHKAVEVFTLRPPTVLRTYLELTSVQWGNKQLTNDLVFASSIVEADGQPVIATIASLDDLSYTDCKRLNRGVPVVSGGVVDAITWQHECGHKNLLPLDSRTDFF